MLVRRVTIAFVFSLHQMFTARSLQVVFE